MIKSKRIDAFDYSKMSFAYYDIEDTPTDDDRFKYHWNVFIHDAKENYKKSIKWLEKIYNEEKDQKRKNNVN